MSQVKVAANAAEDLRKLPKREQQTIVEAIERVRDQPREQLEQTQDGYLKMSIGEYVALFSLEDDSNLHLWTVGERSDVPEET